MRFAVLPCDSPTSDAQYFSCEDAARDAAIELSAQLSGKTVQILSLEGNGMWIPIYGLYA